MDVYDIALAAITRDAPPEVTWSSFAPGEAHAVAIDVNVDIAAVLVVRRYRNDDWSVDVVRLLRQGADWVDVGAGGSTLSNWPPRSADEPDIGPTFTGWSALDDDGVLSAAGLVHGPVERVEPCWSGGVRSVLVGPTRAFVLAVRSDEDDFDQLELRGLSADGHALVNTREQREAARSARWLTISDALRQPAGTEVTVEATLLVLPGQPVILCDDVDSNPPRPKGASVRLDVDTDVPIPPTEFGDGWVSPLTAQVTGVIIDGVLTPLPPPLLDLD